MSFMQECWERVNAGYDLPLFSIMPGYRSENDPNKVTTAFLLYPMRQHQDAQWDDLSPGSSTIFRPACAQGKSSLVKPSAHNRSANQGLTA